MFPSLSNFSASFNKDNSITGRSSFYVAEAIYEEAELERRRNSPENHIYEEIPEQKVVSRPLPPIPEQEVVHSIGGSMFEGASKYEILKYLSSAKDRIGHGNFEIDLDERDEGFEPATEFLGKRNDNVR